MNSLIAKPSPNIYSITDLLKKEECTTRVSYEEANLGKEKSRRNKNELRDARIEILKLKFKSGEIEIMDYLIYFKNRVTLRRLK
jgi:hypothetical protein